MSAEVQVALVGDRDDTITAHRAIPIALDLAARAAGVAVAPRWLGTDAVAAASLDDFDAVWCIPGSPYRDMDGALAAIRHARERGVPFLGTCGGFQHAAIEYARNVLGWSDAEHAETAPGAARAVIELLECGLVEARESLRPLAGTRTAAAYGEASFDEGYRCRYGLNPAFVDALLAGPLRASVLGPDGSIRGVELDGHPFFVGTLFQPERAALVARVPPLVRDWLHAAASRCRRAV